MWPCAITPHPSYSQVLAMSVYGGFASVCHPSEYQIGDRCCRLCPAGKICLRWILPDCPPGVSHTELFSCHQEVESNRTVLISGIRPVWYAQREPSWIALLDVDSVFHAQTVAQVDFCCNYLRHLMQPQSLPLQVSLHNLLDLNSKETERVAQKI